MIKRVNFEFSKICRGESTCAGVYSKISCTYKSICKKNKIGLQYKF
jgi:hypothetical protein